MWWLAAALAGRHAMDHNHPELRWYTLRTAHFDIHYPISRRDPEHPRWMSDERTATRLAEIADDVWMRLATEIGSFPNERIHVVVIEPSDQLVGFTFPTQDWIALSGNPGPELARMRGRADWVSDLLAHELAHVFTLKQAGWLAEPGASFGTELGGFAEAGPGQIGVQLTVLGADPYWWSEGAAEFWSERIGVNTWTSSRDMTLRASALEGRLLGEVGWAHGALLSGWYEPERAYQQGYAFHRWFAQRYGDEASRALTRRAGARLRLDWSRVFEQEVGEDLSTLKQRFEAETLADARVRLRARQAEGLVEGRELALWALGWQPADLREADRWALTPPEAQREARERTGTLNLHPSTSADGVWFARHRAGWTEIRAVDEGMWTAFAGQVPDWDLTRAQRDRDRRMSVWLPARYASDLDFVPGQDALVMVGEEGARRRVRGPRSTAWTQLYLVDLRPGSARVKHRGQRVELPTLEASDGRELRRMRPIPGTLRAMDPSVSPDGERLAYTVYRDGGTHLVVSRLDGSARRQLTDFDDGSWIQGTDWSPDGTQVAFALHRGGQQALWAMAVDTGQLTRLTDGPWEALDPYWAPDGGLWFAADVDGIFDIFRRDPGGAIHRMTRVSTGAQAPSLTPSGNLLYTRYTAFGFKSYGLPRAELLWEEATDRFRPEASPAPSPLAVDPEPADAPPPFAWPRQLSAQPAPTPRRYRPLRALTGLALGPMLRVDRAVDGRVLPRLGAWFRLRDAVEEHTLSGQAWIGADAYARGSWTWHKLWPDLTVGASHFVGHAPGDPARRAVSTGQLGLVLPWTEALSVELGLFAFQVGRDQAEGFRPVHRGWVVSGGLRAGDPVALGRRDDRTGQVQRLLLSRGASQAEDAAYAYYRAEWEAHAVLRAPVGGRAGHRVVLDADLGFTDRPVALDDALRAGGDHGYALRPGVVQGTIALPGYAPYAIAGHRLAVGGLAWRAPLAQDLRLRAGPLVLDALWVQVGGHLGLATTATDTTPLGDVAGQLRARALLFDARWDSSLGLAWGAPAGSVPGGLRFTLGLGTGF